MDSANDFFNCSAYLPNRCLEMFSKEELNEGVLSVTVLCDGNIVFFVMQRKSNTRAAHMHGNSGIG